MRNTIIARLGEKKWVVGSKRVPQQGYYSAFAEAPDLSDALRVANVFKLTDASEYLALRITEKTWHVMGRVDNYYVTVCKVASEFAAHEIIDGLLDKAKIVKYA